jgi:hypothetical protein
VCDRRSVAKCSPCLSVCVHVNYMFIIEFICMYVCVSIYIYIYIYIYIIHGYLHVFINIYIICICLRVCCMKPLTRASDGIGYEQCSSFMSSIKKKRTSAYIPPREVHIKFCVCLLSYTVYVRLMYIHSCLLLSDILKMYVTLTFCFTKTIRFEYHL